MFSRSKQAFYEMSVIQANAYETPELYSSDVDSESEIESEPEYEPEDPIAELKRLAAAQRLNSRKDWILRNQAEINEYMELCNAARRPPLVRRVRYLRAVPVVGVSYRPVPALKIVPIKHKAPEPAQSARPQSDLPPKKRRL